MKKVLVCMAVFVLMAMVFHIVFFDHHHHEGFFGSGIQALTHGENRKKLLILISPIFFILAFIGAAFLNRAFLIFAVLLRIARFSKDDLYNPLVQFFRCGILNPKLCA